MGKTKIEWCDWTINPIKAKGGGWHCTKCSPGCENCYAEKINNRFGNKVPYENNPFFEYDLDLSCFKKLPKKKSKIVFVQDMSDLFCEGIPERWIEKILAMIAFRPEHKFMLLSKRSSLIADIGRKYAEKLINVWWGVTVCTQEEADRKIKHLLTIPGNKFVSIEPMLEPIYLPKEWLLGSPFGRYGKLDWVICGGETGAGKKNRECEEEWVLDLQRNCREAEVPFLFKKFGDGRAEVGGEVYHEFPEGLKSK